MQLVGVCSQNCPKLTVRSISYGVSWDYPGRSISVTRAPDSAVLYAAVNSNPMTDILPARPKANVVISYQKYI